MSLLENTFSFDSLFMKNLRAIISFDVDGTLLDEQDRLHPADASLLIQDSNDYLLIPNTGRPYHSVRQLLQAKNLFTNQPLPLPCVNLNGSAVYGPNGELLDLATFEPDAQDQILDIAAHADETVTVLMQDECCDYVFRSNEMGEKAFARYLFNIRPFLTEHRQKTFSKVMFISQYPETLLKIQRRCANLAIESSSSMPTILELVPDGVNKGTGLQRLLKCLGVEGVPVFAAGDGGNDITFLTMADRAFAPSTSPSHIQALADEIIDTRLEGLLKPILRQI